MKKKTDRKMPVMWLEQRGARAFQCKIIFHEGKRLGGMTFFGFGETEQEAITRALDVISDFEKLKSAPGATGQTTEAAENENW